MAPKRGTKRTAAVAEVSAEALAAKKLQETLKKHSVTKTTYSGVADGINHPLAQGLTDDVRKMLVAMLPEGICVALDEREAPQTACVRMVDEVFKSIMNKMQEQIDTASAALSTVEASKAGLEGKAKEAEETLNAAGEALATSKQTLAGATEAAKAAKDLLAEKEKDQREGDAAYEKAKVEKEALEKALTEEFRLLRDGDGEPEQKKAQWQKLEGLASNIGLEESLIISLPTCMVKKPSERGSFDAMVVAQLEDGIVARIAKLTEDIEAGEPAAAARQAAIDAAAQASETTKQTQTSAAEEYTAATALQQQRQQEHASALEAIANYEPNYAAAKKALEEKQGQLADFQSHNLACFESLRDRATMMPKTTPTEADVSQMARELEVAAAMEAAEAGA